MTAALELAESALLEAIAEMDAGRLDFNRVRIALFATLEAAEPDRVEGVADLVTMYRAGDADLVYRGLERSAIHGCAALAAEMSGWSEKREGASTAVAWAETALERADASLTPTRAAELRRAIKRLGRAERIAPPAADGATCVNCGAPHGGPPRMRHCPDCRITDAPWRPDILAIAHACIDLGIRQPVDLLIAPEGWDEHSEIQSSRRGEYQGFIVDGDDGRRVVTSIAPDDMHRCAGHRIVIARRLPHDFASRIIWHELAHVRQAELDPERHHAAYAAERRRTQERWKRDRRRPFARAHARNPFEIEANAVVHERADTRLLARPNRRATLPHRTPAHEFVAAMRDGAIVPGEFWDRTWHDHRRECERAARQMRA